MHQNHGHNCGAVCYKYAAVNMCWCVGGGVLAFRGFHTDTEALYGVGGRERHTRPEITEPGTSGRLF